MFSRLPEAPLLALLLTLCTAPWRGDAVAADESGQYDHEKPREVTTVIPADLIEGEQGKSPTFLVAALKDPIGANLDRVQIIKGWYKAGHPWEKVYDVVWSDDRKPDANGKLPPVGNTVDVANATWSNTIGDSELITVWKDPDFDPALKAFYYARVIEIPTPRWTAYDAKRFGIEPPKDAGNGTLLNDSNMWTYTPRINRIIKVPSSMMSQSWMGSDFSNKDIAKSTDIIDQYDHELSNTEEIEGHTFYTVTSIPHEDAAVVWGKEVLTVRDDYVLIEQQFWDQDGILVKSMKALEIKELGGRTVASIIRMGKQDEPDEWTQMSVQDIKFDVAHDSNLFTLSNLRNPRQ